MATKRDELEAKRLAEAAARALGLSDDQREAYQRGVLVAMERGDALYHHAGLRAAKLAGWGGNS